MTTAITTLLERNDIHVCYIPANLTDLLQPMDLSVNKPTKDFLKKTFELWYSEQVTQQLHGVEDIQSTEIQAINMRFTAIKHITATWLVEMAAYISDIQIIQFVVNGFRRTGILSVLDDDDEDIDFTDATELLSDEDEHIEELEEATNLLSEQETESVTDSYNQETITISDSD